MIALASSLAAQQADDPNSFRLVLKQADFGSTLMGAFFSDDEHYFALSGFGATVVYDLQGAIEIRRIPVRKGSPVGGIAGALFLFQSQQQRLLVNDQDGFRACSLRSTEDCTTLPDTEGKSLPPLGVWTNPVLHASFYGLPQPNPPGNLPRNKPLNVWQGPLNKTTVYTQLSDAGQLVLFVSHAGNRGARIPPAVLGGSNAAITSVRFVPGTTVLESQGASVYYWDFLAGAAFGGQMDSAYTVDHKTLYFFAGTGAAASSRMFRQVDGQNPQATSFQLQSPPRWFGTSAAGEMVAALADDQIMAFDGMTTKAIPCRRILGSHDPFTTPNYAPAWANPAVAYNGLSMTAFCKVDQAPGLPRESGDSLLVWGLPKFNEMARIPAKSVSNWSSLATDGSIVVLGGDTSLRVAQVATGQVLDIPNPDFLAPGEKIKVGELQSNGRTLILSVDGSSTRGQDRIVWFDLVTRQEWRPSAGVDRIVSLATDRNFNIAVVKGGGTVEVMNSAGTRVATLAAIGRTDWIMLSDSGLFDGTAEAFQWVAFKAGASGRPVAVERLFNELYSPGLMRRAWAGQDLSLPPGLRLATYLDLPGTRTLLQQGLTPKVLDGKAVVCFDVPEMFAARQTEQDGATLIADDTPNCGRRLVLNDQSTPGLTVTGLQRLKDNRIVTPWDTERLTISPARVHVLTAAVSAYSLPGLPDVPTAVPSAKALGDRFGTGPNVKRWGAANCGVDLVNADATKKNILACIDRMIVDAGPDDMAVLLFAGHGGTARTGPTQNEMYEFIAHSEGSQSTYADHAINSAELAEKLRKLRARRVVVVMDACESGALMEPLEGAIRAKIEDALASGPAPGPEGSGLPPQGILLVAASSGFEPALSTATGNAFMDKLSSLLAATPANAVWAHTVAEAMRMPLSVKNDDGSISTMTPVSVAIGADFRLLETH